MTTVSAGLSPAELQKAAREHLWLHFTRMGAYGESEVPVIVRGEGCYLEDINGKRYLDALAGLFAVNIGYSYGDEIGQAAHEQMRELPFYTNWSSAHPRAIELAATVAELAPGDLTRVFFVSDLAALASNNYSELAFVVHTFGNGRPMNTLPCPDQCRPHRARPPFAAKDVPPSYLRASRVPPREHLGSRRPGWNGLLL